MPDGLVKKSMRLFGIPYQFTPAVDPRLDEVSKTIGNNYMRNIILDAPIVTIVPGKPKYLPGSGDKHLTTHNIVAAMNGDVSALTAAIFNNDDQNFRYYDFQSSYIEYMKYVNILCRTCANFLGVDGPDYNIDGKPLTAYDWKNYRMSGSPYSSITGSVVSSIWDSIKSTFGSMGFDTGDTEFDEGNLQEDSVFQNYNFVQFYVDPSVSCSESMGNETTESKIKGFLDSSSDLIKELSFVTSSMGVDMSGLQQFTDSSMDAVSGFIDENMDFTGPIGNAVSNVLSLAGNVIKGENIIIPDIYQSSSYTKSYDLTVHLRTPYKSKYGYYMDVVAPLMHLLALALPRQSTANTYSSPFLVKVYVPGMFNCNLGMVKSISVSKNSESFSVDGYPCDIDVSLEIVDLYSDLSMTPSSSPMLFVNNTSLIEYLANTCGLSLITPNLSKRFELIIDSLGSAIGDIPATVIGSVTEEIDRIAIGFMSLA